MANTGPCQALAPDGTLYSLADRKLTASGTRTWQLDLDDHGSAQGLALTQDDRLIVTRSTQVEARVAATGDLIWTTPLHYSSKGPAVGRDGRVFVENKPDGGFAGLQALDGTTGETLWSASLQGYYNYSEKDPLRVGEDGAVYYKAGPSLIAFDPLSGAERWSVAVAKAVPTYYPLSDPVVVGDVVYIKALEMEPSSGYSRTTGKLLALNTADGTVRWSYAFPVVSSPNTSGPIVPAVGGAVACRNGRVYAQFNGYLAAFDAATGTPAWRVGGPNPGTGPTPGSNVGPSGSDLTTARDGTLYSSDSDGSGRRFRAINPANGATLWTLSGWGGVPLLADDGTVYASTTSATALIR